MAAQHRARSDTFSLYRAERRVRNDRFTPWRKAERPTPHRKASVAACGRRPYRQDNDTPALNALKALRGAPTSMGRGETPVELLPAAARRKAHFLFIQIKERGIKFMSKSNEMQFPFTSKSKGVTITEDEAAGFNRKEENRVPIHLKMTLTIKEAAEYSNIGINKIDSMLRQPNCPFVLYVGTRKLVKRREFEEYIRREITI